MKILILGGTGFVGTAVVQRLIETTDHVVRVFVHTEKPKVSGSRLEFYKGDVTQRHHIVKAMKGVDAVINLIGIIEERGGRTFQAMHVTVVEDILQAMKLHNVKRLLHMSALGSGKNNLSKYLDTKAQAEERIKIARIDYTIIKPSIIWDEKSDFVKKLRRLHTVPFITPLVDGGNARFQPIALSDVSDIFARAVSMMETHYQVYEVGGGEEYTLKDLLVHLAKGKKRLYVPLPSVLLKPIMRFGERVHLPVPVTSEQLTMMKVPSTTLDTRMLKLLKITPRSIF